MVSSGQKITKAQMDALFALGNSNTAIARYYTANSLTFVPYTADSAGSNRPITGSSVANGTLAMDTTGLVTGRAIRVFGVTGISSDWIYYLRVVSSGNVSLHGVFAHAISNSMPLDIIADSLTGTATFPQVWLSELERLRKDIDTVGHKNASGLEPANINEHLLKPWDVAVSGRWPIESPHQYFDSMEFYYADTGNLETLTLGYSGSADAGGLPTVVKTYKMNSDSSEATNNYAGYTSGGVPVFYAGTTTGVSKTSPLSIQGQNATELRCKFSVGGSEAASFSGTFRIDFRVRFGFTTTHDATDTHLSGYPFEVITLGLYELISSTTVNDTRASVTDDGLKALLTIDDSSWLGGTWVKSIYEYLGNVFVSAVCVFSGTPDPGDYEVVFTIPDASETFSATFRETVSQTFSYYNDSNDYISYDYDQDRYDLVQQSPTTLLIEQINSGQYPSLYVSGSSISHSITVEGGVEAHGIHNSKAIKKISAPSFNGTTKLPFGFFGYIGGYSNSDWNSPPYATPTVEVPSRLVPASLSWPGMAYTTSTIGMWLGKVPPAGTVNNADSLIMPWNKWPKLYVWDYTTHTLVKDTGITSFLENQETLRPWQPETQYPQGYCVVDPCGFVWRAKVGGFSSYDLLGTGGVGGSVNYQSNEGGSVGGGHIFPSVKTLSPLKAFMPDDLTPGANYFTEPSHKPELNNAYTLKTGPTWELIGFNLPGLATWREFDGYWSSGSWVSGTWRIIQSATIDTIDRWKPNTTYTVGDRVIDKFGNTQELVSVKDGYGNEIYTGNSGALEYPGYIGIWIWGSGGTFNDYSEEASSTPVPCILRWQLVSRNLPAFTPAKSRYTYDYGQTATLREPLEMPRYPFIWFNDIANNNVPLLDPAGTGANDKWYIGYVPQGSNTTRYKRWIHRIYINRFGVENQNGVSVRQTGSVSVEFGCIRNGSFVSFGSYNTGTRADVFWPIFTSDFLVYKCSERVYVQATILGVMHSTADGTWEFASIDSGESYQMFPICAHYFNDTESILNKII